MKVERSVPIPRLSRLLAVVAAFILLAGSGFDAAIAASDADRNLQTLGLDASLAQPISDTQMSDMRGRYVSLGGQQILYFGLVLQSSLDQASDSLSAGLAFGVNFQSGMPKVVTDLTWATQSEPGAIDAEGSVPGSTTSPLGGISGGIGQVIQVAGIDNQASNQASLDLTTSAPGSLLPNGIPNGAPCANSCQSAIQNNALNVLVEMPGQGSASQTIGPAVIIQNIKLNGDMVQANNSMTMFLQLSPPSGLDTLGISTILQTIPH
jgi:hypothetical protein